MNHALMLSMIAVAVIGGACGGKKEDAGGADKGGPSCAEAAAKYIELEMKQPLQGDLQRLKPTADQLKAATAAVEAHCATAYNSTSKGNTGWSAKARACVVAAQPTTKIGDDPVRDCWKPERGASLAVSQVLFDFAKAETAKAAATPPPPPPATPPADPAAPPATPPADDKAGNPAAGSATTPSPP